MYLPTYGMQERRATGPLDSASQEVEYRALVADGMYRYIRLQPMEGNRRRLRRRSAWGLDIGRFALQRSQTM
jgi:hypothetical protein